MRNQVAEMPVNSVPVRQIIAKTSKWIHVLGSDESLYLLPTVPQTYSYEHAYCDSALLNALGIATLNAAALSLSHDLASQVGLEIGEESDASPQHAVGWRLPKESAGGSLLQILPVSWLRRIINRDHFLEVLILDVWLRRAGQREVVFRQTGQQLEAIFLPSGNLIGEENRTVQQAGYHQLAVYNGLFWAKIQTVLKSKIKSLRLVDLERRLSTLPQIDVRNEVLRRLWSETVVMEVCFDQSLSEVMGAIFSEGGHGNDRGAPEIRTNRIRAISNASRGYPLGSGCG